MLAILVEGQAEGVRLAMGGKIMWLEWGGHKSCQKREKYLRGEAKNDRTKLEEGKRF